MLLVPAPGQVVDEELRAAVGSALGFVRTALGEGAQAEEAYRQALAIAERVGNRRQVAAVCLMRGTLALDERRLADSEAAFLRAQPIAEVTDKVDISDRYLKLKLGERILQEH